MLPISMSLNREEACPFVLLARTGCELELRVHHGQAAAIKSLTVVAGWKVLFATAGRLDVLTDTEFWGSGLFSQGAITLDAK